MMKKILWKDINAVLEVEQEEVAGKQIKFFGKCVACPDKFWVGEMVETPFLYKSGYDIIR